METETKAESLTLRARDGFQLGATLYGASGRAGAEPVVVLASATAVKRTYYDRFARYLASQGFRVVTFDYRGVGDSRPQELRGCRVRMADWGKQDLASVIDWVDAELQPSKLFLVGHSAGGHMLGLAPNNTRFSAVFLVASQSGYWKLWHGQGRLLMFGIWNLLIPGLATVCGYFPGSRVGLGEDLPAQLAREWASWGRHPDFVLGYQSKSGYEAVTAPILSVSISDDPFGVREAVDRAAKWYGNAAVERRHITPRDVGAKAIGHFGFFREKFRDSLWPMAADWLTLHARPVGEAQQAV